MDNVNKNFILSINDEIILPDLQIILVANANIIEKRLKERSSMSRFEKRDFSTLSELNYTNEGKGIIAGLNVETLTLDTEHEIEVNINTIIDLIKERLNK